MSKLCCELHHPQQPYCRAMDAVMTIVKVAAQMYVVQAATGFVVGFTIPWLQFFGIV